MAWLDRLDIADFEMSSKPSINLMFLVQVFSNMAMTLRASSKVSWLLHYKTNYFFLSLRMTSSKHQEHVYSDSQSPTMLSVSMKGLAKDYKVFCFGFVKDYKLITFYPYSTQDYSSEIYDWLKYLSSSFFSSILFNRIEKFNPLSFAQGEKVPATFKLQAFLIFLDRGESLFLSILGTFQDVQDLLSSFDNWWAVANLLEVIGLVALAEMREWLERLS